jgi:hypothetical protein
MPNLIDFKSKVVDQFCETITDRIFLMIVNIYTGNVFCRIDISGNKIMSVNPISNFQVTLIEIVIHIGKLE